MIGVQLYQNNLYMNPLYTKMGVTKVAGVTGVYGADPSRTVADSSGVRGNEKCHTCEQRKYKDGSDENNVSFKAPGNISPEQSTAKVMAHEQEHVANAKKEAMAEGKQLLSASVTMRIGVCPECGRTYIAGGETSTTTKTVTYQENNPYDQARKTIEGSFYRGNNLDLSA